LIGAAALAQQPRIDSVSPSQGPITGGTTVTLTGANFDGATITLDRVSIAPIAHSASEIRLQMPARNNGYAVLAVAKNNATAYGSFLYLPPRLDELPPGHITTIAGVGRNAGDYRVATQAIVHPWGMAFDRMGNTYVAEAANDRVVRIRPDGILEPFAGNGMIHGPRPSHPVAALDATISYPRGIAVDSAGNLYIPDTEYYLWRVTPEGVAEVIAGTGREEFSGDGIPAKLSSIGHPTYIAIDAANNIYFIDATFARVRKIDTNGVISTVVGNGTFGFSGDGGPATQAQFNISFADHGGLAADAAGNLYLLDYANERIRYIDAVTGIIDTLVDPSRAGKPLNDMRGIALDPTGNLYFSNAAELFRRTPNGTISVLTSHGGGFSPDGTPLSEAKISGSILGITDAGELAISELRRVRRVDSDGRLQTIAGTGPGRPDEGAPATATVLVTASDVAILPSGEVAFDDVDRIRKIDGRGIVTTIGGIGITGPIEDVPAIEANIFPNSVEPSANGSIDFSSAIFGAHTIGADGIVRRAAGQFSTCDFSGDNGPARDAKFCQVWDAVRDRQGNLLIADTNNNRVRRVDRVTGIVTTIAGSGPTNGLERYGAGTTCGDGGPALLACINTPYGLAVDDRDNIYVSQVEPQTVGRIRRIDALGTITTFAELPATKLTTYRDHLYAVSGERVVRFAQDGRATTIAGIEGQGGFSGDGGPATSATMLARGQSHGVAIDAEGNVFFADGGNRRIRAVRYGALLPPEGATLQLSAIGSAIRAVVRDSFGRTAPSVRVDFSAPSSGASCTFSQSFAITDGEGIATVTCTPNCIAGTYEISSRMLAGGATASVELSNAAKPCRRRAARH
jgi:trimeric autotransporter adhesin